MKLIDWFYAWIETMKGESLTPDYTIQGDNDSIMGGGGWQGSGFDSWVSVSEQLNTNTLYFSKEDIIKRRKNKSILRNMLHIHLLIGYEIFNQSCAFRSSNQLTG